MNIILTPILVVCLCSLLLQKANSKIGQSMPSKHAGSFPTSIASGFKIAYAAPRVNKHGGSIPQRASILARLKLLSIERKDGEGLTYEACAYPVSKKQYGNANTALMALFNNAASSPSNESRLCNTTSNEISIHVRSSLPAGTKVFVCPTNGETVPLNGIQACMVDVNSPVLVDAAIFQCQSQTEPHYTDGVNNLFKVAVKMKDLMEIHSIEGKSNTVWTLLAFNETCITMFGISGAEYVAMTGPSGEKTPAGIAQAEAILQAAIGKEFDFIVNITIKTVNGREYVNLLLQPKTDDQV